MPDSDFFKRVQSASSLSSMSASGSGASPTRPSLAPSSSSSRTTLKMTLDAAFPIASGSGSASGSRGGAASSAPGSPTKRKVYGDRSNKLKTLLSELVSQGTAPGLVAVAFDRAGIFASAAAGNKDSTSTSQPMTVDSIFWLASASKAAVSFVTLQLAEKHQIDLDSHEQLVKVVPELGKGWEGSQVWQIFDGKNEKGDWKFKEAKEGITLRHILTHTTGHCVAFTNEEAFWLHNEQEKKAPGSFFSGSFDLVNVPRSFESGTQWSYGTTVEYLALFISRLHGTSVRQAFRDLLLDPLHIEADTLDLFRTPEMDAKIVHLSSRGSTSGTFSPLPFPLDTPQYEGEALKGHAPFMQGPLWGTLPSYSKFLQAFLHRSAPSSTEKPLLSLELWEQASRDDLAISSLEVPQGPMVTSKNKAMAGDLDYWVKYKSEDGKKGLGWSLLQATVLRDESSTGLKAGTLSWSGVANTYYFVDIEQGLGGIISSQFLPWAAPAMLNARDAFARWVVENAPSKSW
ncbi:beta-lactamase/transpeptidase-like protein [Leucosporidium creatinivorum]|uniref:Beta-lactamase/transpeptidase-like protein n=1 Tax=Leucosporidium creatinivorum TaxID=106004 RepID=A0A1Y2G041_9BASI|nr:beta-lactamase/transpeptidase-like protein [Leucosporidium creatinivorum]